jgi:hypothetical protein
MNTTSKTPRKLVLQRETIKRLTVEDLRTVRGCGETDCKSDNLCTKVTSIAP